VQKPFYITTPIYYVNDRPHIGHSYTTIAADLLTRFQQLKGRETFFLTGTDEHGSKVAEAAEAAGLKPQEFCDRVVKHYEKAWKALSIKNDDFIRTTQDRHIKAFQKLMMVLKNARTEEGEDVIYSGTYEGLYCTGCEKFLTDKELVNGLCPDHKKAPITLKEKNYFFRLNAYLEKLHKIIDSNELLIMPDERRREVLGLFGQGLTDFSISREKVKWGIPLPFDETQHAYVWIDALFNYITGIGYGQDEDKFKKWWFNAEVTHLMAKDILKFHCIIWPAMLMAANLPLPQKIFLHGFFTVDGEKMSKSLGNQIDPIEMVEEFGTDATRYLLLTQYPFGADGDIQRSRFITKYNSDLANDLGNLVSRVAKMILANFDGKLPGPVDNINGLKELIGLAEEKSESYNDHLHNLRIGNAIENTMALVRQTNKFFDTNAPWKLIKNDELKMAGGVLYACAEMLRIISILMYPLMPTKSLEILTILGLDKNELTMDSAKTFFNLHPGTKINFNDAVFPRLKSRKRGETGSKSDDKIEGLIDISDFGKLQLVVAEVLEAEQVDGADRLLRLQINTGSDKRQIVAGIAMYYVVRLSDNAL